MLHVFSRRFVYALGALLSGLLMALPARAGSWQHDPILSEVLVRKLVTDSAGFQWVATEEGIFRYDGYELVPLARLVHPGGPPPPKGTSSTLCLDQAGNLWFGTVTGLYCLAIRTGVFRRITIPGSPAAAALQVTDLFLHPRSGHLWVSYVDCSVVVLDAAHRGRFISRRRLPGAGYLYQPDGTPTGVWVSFLFATLNDPATRKSRAMPAGVARLTPTGPLQQYTPSPCPVVPIPGTVPLRLFSARALYELREGEPLREVRRWLPAENLDYFRPLYSPRDGAYVWASQRYLLRLPVRGQHVGPVEIDTLYFANKASAYRHSYALHQDALGVQWFYSPYWRGVYKRRPTVPLITQLLAPSHDNPLLSVRGIGRLPDGRLLAGTYIGSFVQAADSPQAAFRPFPPFSLKKGLVAYDLLSLHTRPMTLIAEEMKGFSRLDQQTGVGQQLPMEAGVPHPPTRFLTLLEDQRGAVWGGTDSGLFQLDLRRLQVRRYHPPNGRRLPLLHILDIAEDSTTGQLWLAARQGLFLLSPATGTLQRIGGGSARPLPSDDMMCVAAAGPGRAWAGTRSDGLLLVDAQRGLVQQLGIADGLPSATIATVLCRPEGTVWAGTYAGLIRYDPARQRLAAFGPTAGLTEPELNRNAAYADPRTGMLLFGGVGGLYRISLTTMGVAASERQQPVRLLVTAVSESASDTDTARHMLRPLRSGDAVPALHLGYKASDFVEIRLALTDLLAPEFTHFSYRLRPANGDGEPLPAWQPTTPRLVLRGLTAGDYLVEIRAESGDGQLAANMVRVPLHVALVWWQHPIAWMLEALALVGFAYGVFWLQGLRARREARLRDELAANLHDEVGGLLTKINLMAEVMQQPEDEAGADYLDEPSLKELASRLLVNSRAAVQALRDAVWSIDSRADSAQALLDRMEDYLDEITPAAGLRHVFEADPLPRLQPMRSVLIKQFYLVFKEAITNAVRHGKGATTLHVGLRREGSYFVLNITDDGRAPINPNRRSGLGLRSMTARARTLKGTLFTGPRLDGQPGYQVRLKVRG